MTFSSQNDQLLTEKEFASRFGLSMQTVRTWRVYGKGPKFLKIGRNVRYRLIDIMSWEETLVRSSTSDNMATNA